MLDGVVHIPELQAYIVGKARELGGIAPFLRPKPNGKTVGIIGSGPAGLGAAAVLSQQGYRVIIFEERDRSGGMCNLIPDFRLNKSILASDLDFITSLGNVEIKLNTPVTEPRGLLNRGFDAVIVAVGRWEPIRPEIRNRELAIPMTKYLAAPESHRLDGPVAVIGGGSTALDCAVTARQRGAPRVEMFALEVPAEMPLTAGEWRDILEREVELSCRTTVLSIEADEIGITGIVTAQVDLPPEKSFAPQNMRIRPGTEILRADISVVLTAIGTTIQGTWVESEGVFLAGDCMNGPTTVVEAVASGKNAAQEVHAYLSGASSPELEKPTESGICLAGYVSRPVSLNTEFFGRRISSPFLLSAAPPSDGYDQMKKAYESGWSGGILKTGFDGVPIHTPGEYMHLFNRGTFGNCDNVSSHSLARICREVEKLVREYPDRLTMASTGAPLTGDEDRDRDNWRAVTWKLENAGAMGIEYSLSCPGGDGIEGDAINQDPALTAKVVDWIMSVSDPDIPKIFKLSAKVTAIATMVRAVKEVLTRYPGKKAGISLADTIPVMEFQPRRKSGWEDGVVLGMGGEGVTPIMYFTLARAINLGVEISGNGGVMGYRQAANFLAIGATTVQVCSLVMKYGYGIFEELCSGVSYLMKERGIGSMRELIGIARPDIVTDFLDLSSVKKIPVLQEEICAKCGNCTRCSAQAVNLGAEGYPEFDASKCIGCAFCTLDCFTGALSMRERTPEELVALAEGEQLENEP
jgi:dihydropyrimidine dehydrogenase (NAD+) subunit PreA